MKRIAPIFYLALLLGLLSCESRYPRRIMRQIDGVWRLTKIVFVSESGARTEITADLGTLSYMPCESFDCEGVREKPDGTRITFTFTTEYVSTDLIGRVIMQSFSAPDNGDMWLGRTCFLSFVQKSSIIYAKSIASLCICVRAYLIFLRKYQI